MLEVQTKHTYLNRCKQILEVINPGVQNHVEKTIKKIIKENIDKDKNVLARLAEAGY